MLIPWRPSPLASLFVVFVATAASACGGTSVQHVPGESGGTSGAGGTTSGAGGASARSSGGSNTGGSGASSGGTGGTTGATGGTTGGTGGTTAGTGGTTAGTSSLSCDDIRREMDAELASIQRCMTDAECGQVLEQTSCGCTRDLVARLDADATAFHELNAMEVDGRRCNGFASTCDCPSADGFVCARGRCAWNYVSFNPQLKCTPATMGSMCVVGTPLDSGDALLVGAPLTLVFRPAGCFSSSCTQPLTSSCAVKPAGDDFYAAAEMCLTQNSDPQVGCTDDCGGGGELTCESEYKLTEGTHTVHYEGDVALELTFTVPSVVSDGSLCAPMSF